LAAVNNPTLKWTLLLLGGSTSLTFERSFIFNHRPGVLRLQSSETSTPVCTCAHLQGLVIATKPRLTSLLGDVVNMPAVSSSICMSPSFATPKLCTEAAEVNSIT
jgi:hypothetical protein